MVPPPERAIRPRPRAVNVEPLIGPRPRHAAERVVRREVAELPDLVEGEARRAEQIPGEVVAGHAEGHVVGDAGVGPFLVEEVGAVGEDEGVGGCVAVVGEGGGEGGVDVSEGVAAGRGKDVVVVWWDGGLVDGWLFRFRFRFRFRVGRVDGSRLPGGGTAADEPAQETVTAFRAEDKCEEGGESESKG